MTKETSMQRFANSHVKHWFISLGISRKLYMIRILLERFYRNADMIEKRVGLPLLVLWVEFELLAVLYVNSNVFIYLA